MAWILFAALTVIVIGLLWRVKRTVADYNSMGQKIDHEIAVRKALDYETAKLRAESILANATTERWQQPVPIAIEAKLVDLWPDLRDLLLRYKKITLRENFVDISSEFLVNPTATEDGYVQIGVDSEESESELFVRDRDPKVYDRTHGRIVDEFSSIYHYIVLIEEEY